MDAIKQCETEGAPLPATLFDEAQREIYKIIDKDSFSRFKKNDEEVHALCDALFSDCDRAKSGYITLEDYQNWVRNNPDSMNFLREISVKSWPAVKKVKESFYFRRLSTFANGGKPKEDILRLKAKYKERCLDAKLHEEDDAEAEGEPNAAPAQQ